MNSGSTLYRYLLGIRPASVLAAQQGSFANYVFAGAVSAIAGGDSHRAVRRHISVVATLS